MNQTKEKKQKSICSICGKEIKGEVFLQGGSRKHPAHKKCLIVIKPSKKYGGGI